MEALSVVSSVITIVDFGCKLLSTLWKLHKSSHGVLTSTILITTDLLTLTHGLKRKLPEHRMVFVGPAVGEQSEDDEALDRICSRCVEIAEELQVRLAMCGRAWFLGTLFSPNLCMLKSRLMTLKTMTVQPLNPLDMTVISDALVYAREAEANLAYGFPELLDQLDIAASYQWRLAHLNKVNTSNQSAALESCVLGDSTKDVFEDAATRFPQASRPKSEEDHVWDNSALWHWSYGIGGKPCTFHDLAGDFGLRHYVSIKYDSAIIADQDVNQQLLHQAVSATSKTWDAPRRSSS